ncbi:MAG: hypothetical protein HY828_03435 [Actinobacteria bacterium]|nr:hypothetical protein [Actinomycetota bacterium]
MSDGACSVEYSEAWIDVAAAVEYLGATHRPGLTVWDALAEAVRWWIEGASWQADAGRGGGSLPWSDPDPLRTALESLLGVVGPAGTLDGHDLPTVVDGALCGWLDAMAEAFNDGSRFARRA